MQDQLAFISRRTVVVGSAACASMLMLGSPLTAFADPTSADKQAEAEAALAQLNSMQQDLNQAEVDHFAAVSEQEEAQRKMDESQEKIDSINGEISDLQTKLSSRARSMYRTGASSIIDLLLGATSFKEFTTNWDLLTTLNENDNAMVQSSKELRVALQQEKDTYAQQEKIAADKAAEAKVVYDNAQATVAAMQATYDSLSAEAAALLEQERAAEEAAAAAQAEATVAAAAEEAARWYETVNTESNSGSEDSGNSGSNDTGNTNTNNNNNSNYSEPSYSVVTGNAIVDRAYGCIGIPYAWGGCSPSGVDCSGLVSYCLTGSWSRLGTTYTFLGWSRVSNPQPGDVCTSSYHCGIYIGGGQMIHAPQAGENVKVGSVQSDMVFVRY